MLQLPRKRFGQHFLKDKNSINKIISAIHPLRGEHLVEIGPGRGALTFPLLEAYPDISLTLIEIDRDLVSFLKERKSTMQIYQADVLKFDFSCLKNPLRVIGNLPYNISTPLLFHLLTYKHLIQDMYFMLQKEIVDRLSAVPGSKTYGRLSVMVQYDFDIIPLFTVSAASFYPPPQVESAVVKMIPKQPAIKVEDKILFAQLVNKAFQQRRKTLRNALKSYLSESDMQKLNIKADVRPEVLSVEEYVLLAKYITSKEG